MSDTRCDKKCNRLVPPRGKMGQKYLASECRLPCGSGSGIARRSRALGSGTYETVGYVIEGSAGWRSRVRRSFRSGRFLDGAKGGLHSYRILKVFTAVEATSPPAFAHGRDEPPLDQKMAR